MILLFNYAFSDLSIFLSFDFSELLDSTTSLINSYKSSRNFLDKESTEPTITPSLETVTLPKL